MATEIAAIYLSANSFVVSGDHESDFPNGRPLLLLQGIGGQSITDVDSCSVSGGNTTVVVRENVVLNTLRTIKPSPNCTENTADHKHLDDRTGGLIYAATMSEETVDMLNLEYIPTTGDKKKFSRVNDAETSYDVVDLIGAANQLLCTNPDATDLENKTLLGTANRISVALEQGQITLNAPQDIHPEAHNFTIAGITVSGLDGFILAQTASSAIAIKSSAALQFLRRNAANTGYEFVIPDLKNLSDVSDAVTDSGAAGDTLYRGASEYTRLSKGNEGDCYQQGSSAPAWIAPFDSSLGILLRNLADVRLEYSDANTIKLIGVGGTSKKIAVNKILVDCSTDLTLDTDSASEFVITGTTTVAKGSTLGGLATNNYNNYGVHYLYVANSASAFNFTDYDRRNKLFVSSEAPTADGYLASSGDGANARCAGIFALNGSRQLDNELCVASFYNSENLVKRVEGTGTSWDAITLATLTTVTGCSFNFVVPKGWSYQTGGVATFRNENIDIAEFELAIRDDTTVLADTYNRAANGANYTNEIQMAVSTSKYATAAGVVKLNLAVTVTGTASTPTVRPDYASLYTVRLSNN